MIRICRVLATAIALTALLNAQTQPSASARQAFEVASVKANNSGDKRGRMQMNLPDSFTATNQTLRSLISIIYQVPIYKMSGVPGWFVTETWDIAAKADHVLTM